MTERNTVFYQRKAKLSIVWLMIILCGPTVSAQESLSHNRAAWHSSWVDYDHTAHLATDGELSTSWISKPGDHEWIYIDLGNKCKITGITIYWGSHFAETYEIQVSETGGPNKPLNWKKIVSGKSENGSDQTLKVNSSTRYIKLQCIKSSSGQGMSIREFEISGSGRILKSPAPMQYAGNERILSLSDNQWKTQRSSFVTAKEEEISRADFPDSNWLPASVPATILANYIAAFAVPDPLYGDNQLQVSDWFFTSDFWYRRVFAVPDNFKNKIIRLHFKGINWKADVYVNGTLVGKIN